MIFFKNKFLSDEKFFSFLSLTAIIRENSEGIVQYGSFLSTLVGEENTLGGRSIDDQRKKERLFEKEKCTCQMSKYRLTKKRVLSETILSIFINK